MKGFVKSLISVAFILFSVIALYAISAPIYNVAVGPNPFSPNNDGWFDMVNFNFSLTNDLVGKKGTIKVFSVSGSEVWTKEFDTATAQSIVWDGKYTNSSEIVKGGVYLFIISIDKFVYKGALAVAR